MPEQRQTFEDLFDMPVGLRKFVLSKEFEDADAALQSKYNLTPEQTRKLGDSVMSAIYNDIDLSEAVARIRQSVMPSPIASEDVWKSFLGDVLRLEIWPLRELFGTELTTIVGEAQISTASWPVFRVLFRPLTYSGAATEIANAAGFDLTHPSAHERLRDLIMSRMKNVRIDAQVRELSMRPLELGGLGIDLAMADKIIAALQRVSAQVPILSEEDYANWLAEESRKKSEPVKSNKPQTPDEAEIAAIKAKMSVEPPVPAVPKSVLESAVEATLLGLPSLPTEPSLIMRLKHLVSTRFRDIRSSLEFAQLLQRDTKVGGMGFTKEEADRVAAHVEQAYRTHHEPIMSDEKEKLTTQIEVQKAKIDERRRREAEEHARWYQERVATRKKDEDQKQKIVEQMRSTMLAFAPGPTTSIAPLPIDVKEQKKQMERFGAMVPATDAVARPEVKVSVETAKLQTAQPVIQKQRMDDVVGVGGGPKLMGLLQELKQVTLTEFRRMGATPDESARKILQKFETLAQESFERRLEGIQAWQASPVQEAYLRLVSDAFAQGKTVLEVAEQKRVAGQETLRPEEVSAIISLNSTLHY